MLNVVAPCRHGYQDKIFKNMLNLIMLNVNMLNVIMVNVVLLNVIMLNVIIMNVVAPCRRGYQDKIFKKCYHVRYFELFALQVDQVIEFLQLGSIPFKDSATLAPKLADPPFWWKSNSTPSKSGSAYLIRIDSYVVLFRDVYYLKYSYLETGSRCVNTSFIIMCSQKNAES
jgi:hypothetical protein